MPLALYAGGSCSWGAIPVVAFPKMRLRWVAVMMACVDLLVMPLYSGICRLQAHPWLWGEIGRCRICSHPSLFLSRWTLEDTHLRGRAILQIFTAGFLFLFLLPEIIFRLSLARMGAIAGSRGGSDSLACKRFLFSQYLGSQRYWSL